MAPVNPLAKREAASRVPLTMGETLSRNIESDNGCSVSCKISVFPVGENEVDSGGLSRVGLLSTSAPGVMSTRGDRGLVARVCAACGEPFLARARDPRPTAGQCCSRSCASVLKGRATAARHSQAGVGNHNFRGWASRHKRAYVDRFRAKYPEKARAHDAVKNALRAGLLVKPTICQRCGLRATEPLHAHHEDYTKPLAVLFVCRRCHRELDAEMRTAC